MQCILFSVLQLLWLVQLCAVQTPGRHYIYGAINMSSKTPARVWACYECVSAGQREPTGFICSTPLNQPLPMCVKPNIANFGSTRSSLTDLSSVHQQLHDWDLIPDPNNCESCHAHVPIIPLNEQLPGATNNPYSELKSVEALQDCVLLSKILHPKPLVLYQP